MVRSRSWLGYVEFSEMSTLVVVERNWSLSERDMAEWLWQDVLAWSYSEHAVAAW